MFGFVATSRGYTSRIDDVEREILVRLIADVSALIDEHHEDEEDGPGGEGDDPIAHLDFQSVEEHAAATRQEREPVDPALDRLFPPMSISDPALAVELRGLTEGEVRRSKLANLAAVGRALAEGAETVTVPRGEEGQWLAGLTDVRLVLGARLGIEDDADSRRVHDLAVTATQDSSAVQSRAEEVRMAMASLYSGLAWWQESLLSAVTGDQPGN